MSPLVYDAPKLYQVQLHYGKLQSHFGIDFLFASKSTFKEILAMVNFSIKQSNKLSCLVS